MTAKETQVSERTDESLVEEFVKTGSRGAFAELYYRYKDKVFNTAYRIVGDYEGARDVVHDVFLKVYVEAPGFLFKSSFSSWLYRITANRSLDEARRNKRRQTHVSSEDVTEHLPSTRSYDHPEAVALGHEAEGELTRALDTLSPKLRTVITLRYFEALSYEEIAEIIQRPVGTVKSRLRRAHRRLAATLGDRKQKILPEDKDDGLRDGT